MSATERLPTKRLLPLAALFLAAGLLSLRAYESLRTVTAEPIGSQSEKQLTYLLEPITGTQKVRVSVDGHSPKTVLVMVDGEVATDLRPLRTQVEDVLTAAIGYDAERDTLTLSQFPFARGTNGTLTPVQMAELSGLAVLTLILLTGLLTTQKTRPVTPMRAEPTREPLSRPAARPASAVIEADDNLDVATALAEAKPNETAHLVRGWMSYAED